MLAAVCFLLLGGAWALSRLLLSDVPVPPGASLPSPVVTSPVDPPMNAPRLLPPALARQRDPGIVLPSPAVPAPRPPSPERPQLAETKPAAVVPSDDAQSPFEGASEELDYAEGILGEGTPSKERLESAHDVFKRCVDQAPSNQRCHRALALARMKLGLKSDQSVVTRTSESVGKIEERRPEPSPQAEKMSQIRQPAQLK